MKLFLKISNLCNHNTSTLRTDRQTDRQTTCDRNTALCTKVHRAVKTELVAYTRRHSVDAESINQSNLIFVKRRLNNSSRRRLLWVGSHKDSLNCSRLRFLLLRWYGNMLQIWDAATRKLREPQRAVRERGTTMSSPSAERGREQCWNWPKRTGGSAAEMFEILPRDWSFWRFSLKNERL